MQEDGESEQRLLMKCRGVLLRLLGVVWMKRPQREADCHEGT